MDSIHLLIQFNGIWDNEYNYEDCNMDGIVVPHDCTYKTLVSSIKNMLERFGIIGSIEIKYKLKEGLKPMVVYNDMSMKFYIDLRKTTTDVTQYPLCVTLQEQPGAMVCANTATRNTQVTNNFNELYVTTLNEEQNDDLLMGTEGNDYDRISLENICIISDEMNIDITTGQLYRDKKTLVNVMKNLALQKNFKFKVERSSSTRYALLCAGKQCEWTMRSSSIGGSCVFKIRRFTSNHTCPEEEILLSERHASYATIGDIIKEKFKDPKRAYTPSNIIEDIRNDYGVELNYMKAWRSKKCALELLRGNPSKFYNLLPSYLYMLRTTNPGSVTKLHKTSDNRFKYVYISLNASIKSWKYCRPIIVADACFISDVHGGTLIAASTRDGKGSIVPLAYAVVDSENDKSWEWFFDSFRQTYGVRIAKAYTVQEFEHYMKEVEKIDKRVKKYLSDIGYHKWSRAYAEANRADMMTSNIAESVNGRNKHARSLPIVELLDAMRDMVRKWNWENKKKAIGTFKLLTNKNQSLFKSSMEASRRMTVIPSNEYMYEVHEGRKRHVICLRYKTCTCRRFQLDEMPCPHAHAVLRYNNIDPYTYCSDLCTKENLVKTYEEPVYPMQDQSAWAIPDEIKQEEVLPPKGRTKAGRPKKRRIKAPWEIKCKLACSRCGKQGHNKKTCRNPPMVS